MIKEKYYNIYCDESCHLENDGMPVMVWGGIVCEARFVREICADIRNIKDRHGLSRNFEAKWTKVSIGKLDFYSDLINYFIESQRLRFRGLVVPDKTKINHKAFNQTHDDWYYKMYYVMLKYTIVPPNHYEVFIDIKDTRGGPKANKLHYFLARLIQDDAKEYISKVQQIRSHESELLQLADLIIGALQYSNRNLASSMAKLEIVNRLKTYRALRSLNSTSSFGSVKFNILVWDAHEERV